MSAVSAYLFGLFLCGDADQISLGAGGAQVLDLTAGDVHAGDAYMLLGSMTGTVGFPLAGFVVPLDVDPYLVFTLIHPNTGPLFQSLGILDGSGRASALFALPPGFTPSLAGVTVHHAYGVVDFASGTLEEVSNPVGVELVP